MSALTRGPFIVCGIWMVGLGLYFMLLRPAMLPEDLRFVGKSPAEMQAFAPALFVWLQRVFVVMGGFMAAAGVLTILAAGTVPRSRRALAAFMSAGLLSVMLMSAVNFAIDSDFKWLLIVPALLWVAGVVVVARERT
jgi:hypothetical protein